MYELKCPYNYWDGNQRFKHCNGILKLMTTISTTSGYFGCDQNKVKETWECPVCKQTVHRSWHWEQGEA